MFLYFQDDILIPANGSLRHDQPNVEMNDVSKKQKSSTEVKQAYVSVNGKEKHLVTHDDGKSKLIIRDYDQSMTEAQTASDREKLIKANGTCVDTVSENVERIKYEPNSHQYVDITERQMSNADILRKAQFSQEFGSFGKHSFLVPEDVANSSSGLGACKHDALFSDRSLVYSDSESEGDDMFKVTSLDRRRNPLSEMRTSNSHDGALINGQQSNQVFANFKPPPPPYDTCNTSAIDRTPNKILVRR